MSNEELKPCPFDGKAPKLIELGYANSDTKRGWKVSCECGIEIDRALSHWSASEGIEAAHTRRRLEAIEAWNTRALNVGGSGQEVVGWMDERGDIISAMGKAANLGDFVHGAANAARFNIPLYAHPQEVKARGAQEPELPKGCPKTIWVSPGKRAAILWGRGNEPMNPNTPNNAVLVELHPVGTRARLATLTTEKLNA